MTDKQIDRNNQVEVGLNIAKELLELHKIFEDEVEKNPYVIQTDFIKYKLFYFYQRADWLNVCFKLLEQKLKAKEQECEELKAKCKKYGEINEQETKDYAELKAERDNYIDKYFLESQKVVNPRKVLTEIKEIAEENKETAQYKGICFSILQKIREVIE